LQLKLFQPEEIEFIVRNQEFGPRLWVRRLAIWKDASTLLRDISLRRGVNIIWSPDLSTNGKGATPHGSGKSTFCRLIRYCLGERHFANEDQRSLMQQKLPDGFVGAEIIIDGECWVVTRPIGMNVPSRHSKAERIEDTFDQLLVGTDPPTIGPVISDKFCTEYRNQVPESLSPDHVWDVILAWLTRDQECRLDDVFDWRSKRSGSGSPAQELSLDTKLAVVRLAIGALSLKEIFLSAEVRNLVRQRDELRQELGHLHWFQQNRFDELCERLSLPKNRDSSDPIVRRELIDKADEGVAKAIGITHTKGKPLGTDLISKRVRFQAEKDEAVKRRAEAQALLNTLPAQISAARSEQGIEQARLESGVIVRCAICQVNVDEVLANGCGISTQRCDLEAVRGRIQQAQKNIEELESQKAALPGAIDELTSQIERINGELANIDRELERIERQLTAAGREVEEARELAREIRWFDRKMADRDEEARRLKDIEARIDGRRESIRLERESVASTIGDLETVFQQLVASLMPKGCDGKIRLDGNGLHTEMLMDRGVGLSTAAVESFKIVAFDLAAMILSVNGKARIPSFLMHDSPREADLDAEIYSNLFDFVLSLEDKATPAPFQYIITTTTAPSQRARDHDAMREQLSSTPAEARLFALDF
jgi:predicted nuclease with TOPRIM domain